MSNLAEWMLRQYKRMVSPMLPSACRYVPTCSEYAAEAVACHGWLRGGAMAMWRLLRCHPMAKGGWDPVQRPTARGLEPGALREQHIRNGDS
jgi:uncharacterized protein